ncbi:MAG: CBS domain-containing protein [Myxococcales bacterium]|nr:CBS domain-containing protein [Myxococcales bacterium]
MFRAAFTLMHVRGIPVRLHISLILAVPLIAYTVGTEMLPMLITRSGLSVDALRLPLWTLGLLVSLAMFVAVALHELAHALVALSQGGHVHRITLNLIGGFTEIENDGATPLQQAWMAFAGPLASFAVGALAVTASRIDGLMMDATAALQLFGLMNIGLAALNLVPAYPLDGGRILRALLCLVTTPLRALKTAASFGRLLALVAATFAITQGDPMLLLLAAFLFLGAGADEQGAVLRMGLVGMRARQAMAARVVTVEPERPLHAIARHMLFMGASVALLRDERGTLGVLTLGDVQRGGLGKGASSLVGPPIFVNADDDLADVVQKIRRSSQSGAIVKDDMNTIIGVVTAEDLARAVTLRRASETGPSPNDHKTVAAPSDLT